MEETRKYFVDDISSYYVGRPNVSGTKNVVLHQLTTIKAVFGTNIKTGEGLKEAFDWVRKAIEGRVKLEADIAEKTPALSEKAILNSD